MELSVEDAGGALQDVGNRRLARAVIGRIRRLDVVGARHGVDGHVAATPEQHLKIFGKEGKCIVCTLERNE